MMKRPNCLHIDLLDVVEIVILVEIQLPKALRDLVGFGVASTCLSRLL